MENEKEPLINKKTKRDQDLIWGLPRGVASFVVIALTSVMVYRIATMHCDLQFDFASFLSLLLALFSVALSALFYFKATDTSNAFYDNTYKFTQQIAELLVKIESGFGERLKHLDEAYHGMRDSFDKLPGRMQVSVAKQELAQEQQSVEKLIAERDKIIQELASKAQLNTAEKERIISQLQEKDKALGTARAEIALLSQRLMEAQLHRRQIVTGAELDPEIMHFMRQFMPELGMKDVGNMSPSMLKRRFEHMTHMLPKSIVSKMQHQGVLADDGSLTPEGSVIVRNLFRNYRRDTDSNQSS